jgi:phosphoserine phosphatase
MTKQKRTTSVQAEALERILAVTRRLAAPFELETMLSEVVEAARAVLRAERGTVFLYDPVTRELFSKVATGTGEIRFPADRGIAGECAQSRLLVNVPDCYADARFNPEVDRRTGYRTRCLLTVPLVGHDDSLVGVLQVLNKEGGVFTAEDEGVATALAAQCAVALQRVRLLEDLLVKQKMERELAVAREIQMRVLPQRMPSVPGYDIDGWSRPADETGGDIFDGIPLPGERVMLLLGDATGHGIGPALSVTQVRAMLRVAVRLGAGIDAAYTQINAQLTDDLSDNRFVTVFLGELDASSHRLQYHSGGQGPLLHFHAASGECELLTATTFAMGMIAGIPLKPPKVFELAPGDIVALITDGIFEYANRSSELFGEERTAAIIREHGNGSMAALRERIVSSVAEFADGAPQGDDMTIVLVRRLAAQ